MAAKIKQLTARRLSALRSQISDAEKDGWETSSEISCRCGVYYVVMRKKEIAQ